MPQNLLSIDDIYKNYGEALKHYSKVSKYGNTYVNFCPQAWKIIGTVICKCKNVYSIYR